jgi:hypothetical protein
MKGVFHMKRRKLSKKKSRKIFTKGAVNVKNVISALAQCAVVSGFNYGLLPPDRLLARSGRQLEIGLSDCV